MDAKRIAVSAIARHGIVMSYDSVITGLYDPNHGKVVNTKATYTVKMYPKQFIANQYNYPTLVGKETIMFYLANSNLGFIPKIGDDVTYKSKAYRIQSIQEHFADGEIALYKLIGVRG